MATDVATMAAADASATTAAASYNNNNNNNNKRTRSARDDDDGECVRFVYRGHRYRVPAQFVRKQHPGGARVLMRYRDEDMTAAFDAAAHSADAYEMLEEWCDDDDDDDNNNDNNNNSSSAEAKAARKAALAQRAQTRRDAEQRWRWRSTVFAFTVAGVLAAVAVRHAPPLRT